MADIRQLTQPEPNRNWTPQANWRVPNIPNPMNLIPSPMQSQTNQGPPQRPNFIPNRPNQPPKFVPIEPINDQPKTETKRVRAKTEPDDEETVRRRDILVSVALLGELEQYVGENVEPARIRNMKRKELDSLFAAYEAKLGKEMTENGMETIVGSAVKLINWFVPIDDSDALKADLLENKPLRRSLGRHCAGMAERYGDFVAFSKVIYDVVKHIKLSPEVETPPTDTVY